MATGADEEEYIDHHGKYQKVFHQRRAGLVHPPRQLQSHWRAYFPQRHARSISPRQPLESCGLAAQGGPQENVHLGVPLRLKTLRIWSANLSRPTSHKALLALRKTKLYSAPLIVSLSFRVLDVGTGSGKLMMMMMMIQAWAGTRAQETAHPG